MNNESFESTRPDELTPFIGHHVIYTYDNGWQYELYLKNADTIDYRIHGGMVGGRWVKDQKVHLARLSDEVCKVSWHEPTGTSVSLALNLSERRVHGIIFFPRWVAEHPERTVCYQNDHLEAMVRYRDAGPTYPYLIIDEFATLTFKDCPGPNDERVIACAPEALPEGFADRRQ
ncbi:phenolic acid decarboxylase [Larsenimonas suaedae]|uniref:Phenolic acid decarboxylase n=1 Tax=Larsenimonas suaedae TaxID=1851019 RepID=A0ABU1GVV1_9GAMM|nr:phenolic acid decarboxylase [Larsenimonas suaedae]MDR5896139.1 phenolic acid decarboxylase [Larsenimonas suaedae]